MRSRWPVALITVLLVGILLGLTRMSSDGEVTAMRACGMGARAFFAPLAVFIGLEQ